jgi:hypothetical protein
MGVSSVNGLDHFRLCARASLLLDWFLLYDEIVLRANFPESCPETAGVAHVV